MLGLQKFRRTAGGIETPGIDYGNRIQVLAEKGDRLLCKVAGSLQWSGNYLPRKYEGTMYFTATIINEGTNGASMEIEHEEQPGRLWRPAVRAMMAWVNESEQEPRDGH